MIEENENVTFIQSPVVDNLQVSVQQSLIAYIVSRISYPNNNECVSAFISQTTCNSRETAVRTCSYCCFVYSKCAEGEDSTHRLQYRLAERGMVIARRGASVGNPDRGSALPAYTDVQRRASLLAHLHGPDWAAASLVAEGEQSAFTLQVHCDHVDYFSTSPRLAGWRAFQSFTPFRICTNTEIRNVAIECLQTFSKN